MPGSIRTSQKSSCSTTGQRSRRSKRRAQKSSASRQRATSSSPRLGGASPRRHEQARPPSNRRLARTHPSTATRRVPMSIFKYVDPDDGLAYEMNYIVTHGDEGPEYVEYRLDPSQAGSLEMDTSWHRLPPWATPPQEAMEFW